MSLVIKDTLKNLFNSDEVEKLIYECYNQSEGLKKNKTYEQFIYEAIGCLRKDFNASVQDLKNLELINWEASVFENNRKARKDALSKVLFKPVAIKGLHFCPKCKGDEFTYWQAQTRSNDEQTTTFRKCIKCNFS